MLARDDDGPADGILPPTWREEDADWTAHEEEFEPAMFSDERTSLGALDETGGDDEERRPWEFDLDSVKPGQPGPGVVGRPHHRAGTHRRTCRRARRAVARRWSTPAIDEPVFTGEATVAVSSAAVAAAGRPPAAPSATDGDEGGPDATGTDEDALAVRPSGTPRVGRARRSGLLPARLKAKRPEEADELAEPLAAEPPGASVADVPGAGRRRTGLAGLAAADRIADQSQATEAEAGSPAEPEPAAEPRSRRSRRRSAEDRPPRSSSNYTPEVTGGVPPPPVPAERVRREPAGGTAAAPGCGWAPAWPSPWWPWPHSSSAP